MEDHIGNKCTIVCFNVSISSVNIIYIYIYIYMRIFRYLLMHCIQILVCACIIMFYQINSLTHNFTNNLSLAISMTVTATIGYIYAVILDRLMKVPKMQI